MIAWHNYIIIATFEGVETAIRVETATRVETAIISQWRRTRSVFSKLFQVVQIVITSGAAACLLPNDCYLFDKQSW